MRFETPEMLWALAGVMPLLVLFLWHAWGRRRRLILQFVQSRLLAQLTVGVSTARQKLRMVLVALAILFVLLALARPQLGFDWEEARQRGLDIVVAIDTSRSMLAQDILPNRLVRAKLAAMDLRRLARSDRLGLAAFAGTAFLQCPLTLDDEVFRQSVDALDASIIPQGGTAIAEAIRVALEAFKDNEDNYKVLVLFTDGEDHDGQALEAAREAAEKGLRIFTVGVGTKNGELLRVTDAQGRTEFIKDDQGQVVKSRLDEPMLQSIAAAAQGFYLLLTGADTIELLYERGLAPLPKSEFASRQIQRYHERYQWPLALALILLIVEIFMPERKRSKRGEASPAPLGQPSELTRVALWLLLMAIPTTLAASPQTALKKYKAGQFVAAQLDYERALEKTPNEPRLQFNAGAAAFQARDYERARQHLEKALVAPDLSLQQKAFYNLGNAQFRMGENISDPTSKQQAWQEAVSSYEGAVKLDPEDADARHNLELARKRLEELKQQQQQQKQDQKQDEQDEKNEQGEPEQNQGKEDQQQNQDSAKQEDQPGQQEQQQEREQETDKPSDQQAEQQQAQPSDQNKEGTRDQEGEADPAQDGKLAAPAQMTPEQARQLLDSLRSEERPLIFVPETPARQRARSTKNW